MYGISESSNPHYINKGPCVHDSGSFGFLLKCYLMKYKYKYKYNHLDLIQDAAVESGQKFAFGSVFG